MDNRSRSPPPVQIVCRHKGGWNFLDTNCNALTKNSPGSFIKYSRDGKYLAVVNDGHVEIWCTNTMDIRIQLPHPKVRSCVFSPKNTYLLSYHFKKDVNEKLGNAILWNVEGKKEVMRFHVPQASTFDPELPPIRFTHDERLAFKRFGKHQLSILDGENPNNRLHNMNLEYIQSFSVSPRNNQYFIAVFIRGRKARPSRIEIHRINLGPTITTSIVASRLHELVEDVVFRWNCRGDRCLVICSTAVDKSSQSYYGGKHLILMDVEGMNWQVKIDDKAPLQDAQWHPNGIIFGVIDGYPLRAALFDAKQCQRVFDFGISPRNTIRFGPLGHFLMLGGFGNLPGKMDFWNLKTKKKLGESQDASSKVYEWAPDGRTFFTVRPHPWRRVENGFSLRKYNGSLVKLQEYDECYQVLYRPAVWKTYEAREVSPGVEQSFKAKKASGGYIPPHLRGKRGTKDSISQKLRGPAVKASSYSNAKKSGRRENKGDTGPKEARTEKKAKTEEKGCSLWSGTNF